MRSPFFMRASLVNSSTVFPLQLLALKPVVILPIAAKQRPSELWMVLALPPVGLFALPPEEQSALYEKRTNDFPPPETSDTTPMYSPSPLAESLLLKSPLLPSRKNSVYPRLKVFSSSGTNVQRLLPQDALERAAPPAFFFSRMELSARSYFLTMFFTYDMFLSRPSILKDVIPASIRSSRREERLRSLRESNGVSLTSTLPFSSTRS